ncbi:PAS-domain containing protein [Dankookia sp. P2]|uniref:PAS-domain containing protein n=1 Tax=Dankookia sp. P2 TaxID=3423955 RepID=UPI003D663C23
MAANRLASELSAVPAEMLHSGMRFEDAVRFQRQAGVFGQGEEAAAIERLALGADRTRTVRYQRREPGWPADRGGVRSDRGWRLRPHLFGHHCPGGGRGRGGSRAGILQAALDHMRHGLLIYGPDRRLLAANALAAELSGLAPEDVAPGAGFDDLVRRQHASGQFGPEPEATAVLQRLLAADRSRRGRRIRHSPDGRQVEVFTDPTPDGGFVISFTDITARARAEAEAKQRAGLLRDALDSMRHGLMLFGPDRRLLTANRLAGPDYGIPDLRGREGVLFETLVAEQAAAADSATMPWRRRWVPRCSRSTAASRRATGGGGWMAR